jgi:hypothetical protein
VKRGDESQCLGGQNLAKGGTDLGIDLNFRRKSGRKHRNSETSRRAAILDDEIDYRNRK